MPNKEYFDTDTSVKSKTQKNNISCHFQSAIF